MIVIGVDPGRTTGLATCEDGILRLCAMDFWNAHRTITQFVPDVVDMVVIEVATATHVWHPKGKQSVAIAARTGQHVGAVRREGELMAEGLQRMGYNVKTVPPAGKVDADVFKAVTGYSGRTNEHTRDAGMLAFKEYCKIKQAERADD